MQLPQALTFFEIKPAAAYTAQDLNWKDPASRSSLEMQDPTSRPEMAPGEVDISGYDMVFIGFPVWWYIAPTIINTFLEKHDFSGKTIVLFATSGGSGFGNTVDALKGSVAQDTVFIEGKLLNRRETHEDLVNWVNSL